MLQPSRLRLSEQPTQGDLWNDEDLSVFSAYMMDDPDDLHSGGRALPALVRPVSLLTRRPPLHSTLASLSVSFMLAPLRTTTVAWSNSLCSHSHLPLW